MVAEAYRKNSNNRSVCYVVGVASSGKVWCFFCFFMFLKGAEQLRFCCILHPFSKVGNSRLHSIPTDYLSFYGIFILGYIQHCVRRLHPVWRASEGSEVGREM